MFSGTSSRKRNSNLLENENKDYNYQFEKLNYGINRSQEQVEVIREELNNQYNLKDSKNDESDSSKFGLRSEDQFRMNFVDKAETRSENAPLTSFILHKVENSRDVIDEEPY